MRLGRVENLEPRKIFYRVREKNGKQGNKKRKQNDSNSTFLDSSEESLVEHRQVKEYCILQGKFNHTMDKCKHLKALVKQHWEKSLKSYVQGKKELNALIEKKYQKYKKNKKRKKTEKELNM